MKSLLVIILLVNCFISFSQEEEYREVISWTGGAYVESTSDEITPLMKDITVLVVYGKQNSKNLLASIANNPQLRELQLEEADQQLLNTVFALSKTKLQALIIEDFQSLACYIPECKIEHLTQLNITSESCKTLEFSSKAFKELDILFIEMDNLESWKGSFEMETLGLLDVSFLKLKTLPTMVTPHLYEYSLNSSAPFPTDICNMPELTLLSVTTTIDSQLSPCHQEMMKRDGLMEFTTFSEDDEKRTSIKSESTLRFEEEMH